jgi:2-hydroxychromene-2-carboxylate isomerase
VSGPPARFFFDLSSPLAYLAAERVLHVLPGPAEWQPVLARELSPNDPLDPLQPLAGGAGGAGGEIAQREAAPNEAAREQIVRRAQELGLQPVRWPDPFPFDSALAMRVATYAKSIGRVVPFAQAAFRQAFAGGHSLEDLDFVLIAAAACEMHPSAVLAAAELRSVGRQLADATANASRTGIIDVPAVAVDELVFTGAHALEQASAHMRASAGVSEAAASPGSR